MRIQVTRQIAAPPAQVFDTVAHVERFRQAVPQIVRTEILGPTQRGAGTRFRETRQMGKREVTTELEITEYVPPERVRIVADAGGTTWDTLFLVRPAGGGSELQMTMDARARRLWPRLLNVLIKPMVGKVVARDMDAVKAFCERQAHG